MSNSPVIAFLNKMTDLILLNILYIICCIPIVTIGAATTAMYYVCLISIRQGDGYVAKRFFQSFRREFKQATLLWIPMLLIGILLGFDLFFWYQMGTMFSKVMFVLSMVVTVFFVMVGLYVFPMLSKFECDALQTVKNAAAFAVGYLHKTLILLVVTGGFVYANLVSLGMNAVTSFVGFAVVAYVKSFFIYKAMMNHMDERYDDFLVDE